MNKKILNGILYSAAGSFWWGIIGVFYFKKVSFVGSIELVIHRTIWTVFVLAVIFSIYSRWSFFFETLKDKKKIFLLLITGILILINWVTWIYAVTTNRLIDASFGYFIFPILSILFGYIFFKEKLNKKKKISVFLVLVSIIYLLINFKSIPWIGFTVALSWSIYNLLRKKINVPTDIGLFIESVFISPVALTIFYFIVINDMNDFSLSNPKIMFLLFLAGPMTVIPLYMYLRGVEGAGLSTSGMIFFITPTCHFLLGVFYFNEVFTLYRLIGFIFIWIAVTVYLQDLNKNK